MLLLPGLQFLEVTAFFGVYLSLIVYLQDVLHGDSASNVASVNLWAGVSFVMPLLGATVADSCWVKYKTVLIGYSIAGVGMAMVTTAATLPSLSPSPCAYCAPATLRQELLFFSGIYLCGVGLGGSKAVFMSFGAEQFDDKDDDGKKAQASYFGWYYAVGNKGMLTAGTLVVWVQDKVSWGIGYGICGLIMAVAVVGLAATAPMYRMLPPMGSPWKEVLQVLCALSQGKTEGTRRCHSTVRGGGCQEPVFAACARTIAAHRPVQRLCTRFLDKAAIITDEDLDQDGSRPWRLCTVTRVEELKTLLRLIPIWLTLAVYFVANTQAQTTFVQQGTKTDSLAGRE